MEARQKFEALLEIADLILKFDYSEVTNTYHIRYDDMGSDQKRLEVMYLGGAWMAFQEQEKKISALESVMDEYYTGSFSTIEELAGEISSVLAGTED